MSEACFVGIDLGGTSAKSVRLLGGSPGSLHRLRTDSAASPQRILDDLAGLAKRAAEGAEISALGIAMPGLVDPRTGRNAFAGNLHWQDISVRDELEHRLGIPVAVENDANAAALGEYCHGTAAGLDDFVFVSLGTGIGGGIFSGGRLITGCRGAAGEVGHMIIRAEGPPCTCGARGCLEALAGGWAITRDARAALARGESTVLSVWAAQGRELDVKTIYEAAAAGDLVAEQILGNSLHWLGLGVANLVNLLNPELVVLGGGLSLMGEPLLAAVVRQIGRYAMPVQKEAARIALSQLGDRAGVMGAVELARRQRG